MTKSIEELETEKSRLAEEMRQIDYQLALRRGIPTTAEALRASRAYALDAALPVEDVVQGCSAAIDRYGFCVIDNVIPIDHIAEIKLEAEKAEGRVEGNTRAVREGLRAGKSLEELANREGIELRPVCRSGYPPKIVNDIVWLPKYAAFLANATITAVARAVLDDHLKIGQLHLRHIVAASEDGSPGGWFGTGRPDLRAWHTDWPHDLSAYGGGDPNTNVGSVRQPFPDVTFGLTMIWYLTDVDEDSGATFVVPGSHRDPRNPRGPNDGISVGSPIPGEMQITAKAGSVFIQDSRCWHASPMHNNGEKRIAIVNRWSPWWIAVDGYASGPESSVNQVCRPLAQREFEALPRDLKPLMRHLCPTQKDVLQAPVLDRAKAADERTKWGFRLTKEQPENVVSANEHIKVHIRPD
ncbi:MAG: phytanoyl-CoA dioxygenase family protein [Candidatus Azotimanducaceae bacterium]